MQIRPEEEKGEIGPDLTSGGQKKNLVFFRFNVCVFRFRLGGVLEINETEYQFYIYIKL